MSTITQIRARLEARAASESGTRPYWDCVATLLDIAEAAQEWADAAKTTGPRGTQSREPFIDACQALRDALGNLPKKAETQ